MMNFVNGKILLGLTKLVEGLGIANLLYCLEIYESATPKNRYTGSEKRNKKNQDAKRFEWDIENTTNRLIIQSFNDDGE